MRRKPSAGDNPKSGRTYGCSMTSPLERAARAILPMLHDEMNMPFNESDYGSVPMADEIVRAVLTAVREPGEGMKNAGGEQVLDTEYGPGQYEAIPDGRGSRLIADEQAANAWRAMVDAALEEG
jgi:hypothetical protein